MDQMTKPSQGFIILYIGVSVALTDWEGRTEENKTTDGN